MQIARVRGTVTSTQKDPSLRGVKLLMLQLIDENGNLLPIYEVAADNSVGAGVDEWVLVSRGSAARQILGNEQRPLDAAVVAIIDTIHVEDRVIYSKKDQYR
ncbi:MULTISPECIES: EutN/CcmL family microcompartment protein [unclassified Anabaena]|jgi:carbon dioxide concentrating mechanism protein CcmL|uniref:EutN/CcmL family microcompartment protein n=1 Tax=unclassified Anabaena TaxID=2619674 RepID=UPI001446FD2C|nr:MULTISPECIES: EutN/CcmL family microcompartment protein [unclassified Anabaena]MTJ09251.1 carbon dioxide concentrating mechanism protein CcmL [Anabaena sp. UHCC 0204]MTJ52357.1 carbon dioxide concentrating mechanism protein CcmL [Anabaena sp. UHCC 0253]